MVRLSFPLRTERLLLRPFSADDFEAVYAIESREDVMRYLYWQPRARDEARASLERRLAPRRTKGIRAERSASPFTALPRSAPGMHPGSD